ERIDRTMSGCSWSQLEVADRGLGQSAAYDQRIDGGDIAAGADQRVEVEFADELALVSDEFGSAADDVAERPEIDTWQPAIAPQQTKGAQFAHQRLRLAGSDRRRGQGGVAQHLDQNPAQPDDHQRAELRVDTPADDDFDARRPA